MQFGAQSAAGDDEYVGYALDLDRFPPGLSVVAQFRRRRRLRRRPLPTVAAAAVAAVAAGRFRVAALGWRWSLGVVRRLGVVAAVVAVRDRRLVHCSGSGGMRMCCRLRATGGGWC